jgi:hypothetical protein
MLRALLLLAALVPAWDGRDQDPLANGDVREVHLTQPPGTRVEYFRLDTVEVEPAERASTPPVGLVRWISAPPSGEAPGWRAECEVLFFAEGRRVIHSERLDHERRELVFREVGERSGRTLRLVWTPDGQAVSTEATGDEVRRRTFDLAGGAVLPLAVVELARRGAAWRDEVPVFLPLANAIETLVVELSDEGATRTLRLSDAEGLGRGSYRFQGRSLVAFRWQDGGLLASAVERAEHDHWLAQHRAWQRDRSRAADGD